MSKFGGWVIKPNKNYPQKIASAVSEPIKLFGAKYNPIMYLAEQPVNGTNHAVLASQVVQNGEDTTNAVILVFNEKPDSMDVSLIDIQRIVENGGPLGGTKVTITTNPSPELQDIYKKAIQIVGESFEFQAFLGTKMTKGIEYKFLVTLTPIVAGNVSKKLAILTYNPMTDTRKYEFLLADELDGYWTLKATDASQEKLGYAFTWLRVAPNII